MAAAGDDDFSSTVPTRPGSLWPQSERGAPAGFVATRFDPAAGGASDPAAVFDLCQPTLALRALLLVQAVLAVAALALADSAAGWGRAQAAAAFGGTLATLLWLVPLCAARRPLHRAGAQTRAAIALLLGAAAALAGWLPLWALDIVGPDAAALRLAGIAAAGAGIAALLWTWLSLRARIRQPADASARLAELQSRIQPHFLFNALNTALALVRSDPARAENVLEDLSELFRAALAETGASVSLDEEIALAKSYLAIEQARFGSRMAVEWDIAPAAGVARVPPLVLQPLVENAVRHGIEPAVGGGRVWVRAGTRHGSATLTVSNTVGTGDPPNPGHGIALDNVRERLRLLHDVAAQCDTWRDDGVFHARIVLPLP